MSETKLEVKTAGHSEKISLTSEIFAKLAKISDFANENLAMSNSEIFLNFLNFFYFFEISLGFSLKLGISLGTVPSEIFHFRFSQNFR